MRKVETYRQQLRRLTDWEPFLLKEFGLPGPRGNVELAQAVAEEGNEVLFEHFIFLTHIKLLLILQQSF